MTFNKFYTCVIALKVAWKGNWYFRNLVLLKRFFLSKWYTTWLLKKIYNSNIWQSPTKGSFIYDVQKISKKIRFPQAYIHNHPILVWLPFLQYNGRLFEILKTFPPKKYNFWNLPHKFQQWSRYTHTIAFFFFVTFFLFF